MVVGKDDELGDIDDESLARVRLIADRKRQLEEAADQVSPLRLVNYAIIPYAYISSPSVFVSELLCVISSFRVYI